MDGFEGVVTDIKTRYTLIRARQRARIDRARTRKLITERVENLSLADTRVLLTTDVIVGYDSDPDQVQQSCAPRRWRAQRVLKDPPPVAHLASSAPTGSNSACYYWIDDPPIGQLAVRSDVNLRRAQGLARRDIDIPYPQRVVHVKQESQSPISSATATTG